MQKKVLFISAVICTSIFLLSWSLSEDKPTPVSLHLTDASILLDEGLNGSLPKRLSAEDVLVQKIKGDNSHLLLMAYYSKENFSGTSVELDNAGDKLVLRDDGKGDDMTAGDGMYTLKIGADVAAFRQMAHSLNAQQLASHAKRFHFENRALVYDAGVPDAWDENGFDNNQAVSINSLNTVSDPLAATLKTNSLFITKPSVVEDPLRTWNPCAQTGTLYGAWTYQKLMRELATVTPGKPPTDKQLSAFVLHWLDNFSFMQIINGDTVDARPLLKKVLTDPWMEKSRNAGAPVGQLDMRFAPFKLLAIVNRFDQRESFSGEPAGEARFIFTLLMSDCTDSKNYTLAIEYKINKPNVCDSLQSWANQWYNLKNLTLGSKIYNTSLQKITDQFTLCGNNPAGLHQNCFKSLRTNDQALTSGLDTLLGEFREFVLSPTSHTLVMSPVTNAVADRYNGKLDNPYTRLFANYVNKNTKDIINNPFTEVPLIYKDSFFLGGKAKIVGAVPVGYPLTSYPYYPFHIDGTEPKGSPAYITNNSARHIISLNACNGCHAGETQTNFWHVDPTFYGKESNISGFLGGKADGSKATSQDPIDWDKNPNNDSMVVMDPSLRPSGNPQMYIYNDILRRATDLQDFVNYSCGSVLKVRNQLMFKPLNMVH